MKKLRKLLGLLALVGGLTAAFALSSLALTPGQIDLTLSYTVPSGAPSTAPTTGDPVTCGGAVKLLEDGVAVLVGGDYTVTFTGGSVSLPYAFNPTKSYSLYIEEATKEPFYEAKEIVLTSAQIAAASASGLALPESVDWVEWVKPITVQLVDAAASSLPYAGETLTLVCADKETGQTITDGVTAVTNASGIAKFPSWSYDASDPDMCNILNNQIMIKATVGTTTAAKVYDLVAEGTNEIDFLWPEATASGTVKDVSGNPRAKVRVASYRDLPALGVNFSEDSGSGFTTLGSGSSTAAGVMPTYTFFSAPLAGTWVAYTETDASGNYTLALPAGVSSDICAEDGDIKVHFMGGRATAPYDAEQWISLDDLGKVDGHLDYMHQDNYIYHMYDQLPVANYAYFKQAAAAFPYINPLFYGHTDEFRDFYCFNGLFCREVGGPLSVAPTVSTPSTLNITVADAPQKYTLTGKVQVDGKPYSDTTFTLAAQTVPPAVTPGLHANTSVTPDTSRTLVIADAGGAISKNDENMLPGFYTASITVNAADSDKYSRFDPLTVEIKSSEVAVGAVDLGTMNFTPVPKPPEPPVRIPVAGGSSSYRPGSVAPVKIQGYPSMVTRMEVVRDPSYSGVCYEVTLHYTADHSDSTINSVDAEFSVKLPKGVTVPFAGGMTVTPGADGAVCTRSIPGVPVRTPDSFSFIVDVTNMDGNYGLIECSTSPNLYGNTTLTLTSAQELQRLKITLNAPRTAAVGGKLRIWGDVTGADGSGVKVYDKVGAASPWLMGTGAQKGRYYYFDVAGLAAADHVLTAETTRNGSSEASAPAAVKVSAGVPSLVDVKITTPAGDIINKSPKFQMVNYTTFVDAVEKRGGDFTITAEFSAPLTSPVKFTVCGRDYVATNTSGNVYEATVSGYAGYGEEPIMLSAGSGFETQVGRLLLLF